MSTDTEGKFRVLVIEDDPYIARLVMSNLQKVNVVCRIAPDGNQGLIEFRDFDPHLVLTDLMMPGLDGRSVCSAIREISMVPIIMMTAADTSEAELQAFKAGADDYIPKPFDPKLLVARVVASLRRVYRYGGSAPQSTDANAVNATEQTSADAGIAGHRMSCKMCGHQALASEFRREDARGQRLLICPQCGEREQFSFD